MKPLRSCKDCELEAWSENDLALFRKDYSMLYNRANLCKKCDLQRGYNRCETNRLNTYYKRTYGVTYEEVQRLKEKQEYKCKICNKPEGNNKMAQFVVDHCHDTGEVRGILCGSCNTALGHLEDDVARLARAIEYLTIN